MAAAKTPQRLTASLWSKLPRFRPVEDLIVLRVSARSKQAFENQEETGMAVFGHLSDVAALSQLPGSILDDDAQSLRDEYGFVAINTDDVSPYATTARGIGYLGSKGQTVFLFIMDSAIQEQIRPPHDPLGQNAFTELVIQLCYELRPNNVRFAFWSRLTRASIHGARITEAIRRIPGMTLWDGNSVIDLHSSGGRVLAGVNSGVSESDAANLKEGTLVGRINHAKAGLWPINPKSLSVIVRVAG